MISFNSDNSNDTQFVEVNGIRFEILLPQSVVVSPKKGEEITIQLGVRITNLTTNTYCFDLPWFLPDLLHPCGKLFFMDGGRNVTKRVKDTDIPLLEPNESLEFWLSCTLGWLQQKPDAMYLSWEAIYGGLWHFRQIQPLTYQIRLTYENLLPEKKKLLLDGGWANIKSFWTGKVSTPFVNFTIQ
jgi:hypothetical protein